jgi:hypothetical protein
MAPQSDESDPLASLTRTLSSKHLGFEADDSPSRTFSLSRVRDEATAEANARLQKFHDGSAAIVIQRPSMSDTSDVIFPTGGSGSIARIDSSAGKPLIPCTLLASHESVTRPRASCKSAAPSIATLDAVPRLRRKIARSPWMHVNSSVTAVGVRETRGDSVTPRTATLISLCADALSTLSSSESARSEDTVCVQLQVSVAHDWASRGMAVCCAVRTRPSHGWLVFAESPR